MPRKPTPETPLYVKLPSNAVDKLHRAAVALGVAKKDLVAGLVSKYVDPDSQRGLSELGALPARPQTGRAMLGTYSFQPYEQPEAPAVMSASQAALFLQIDENTLIGLAESGELPGKKLGAAWRFSRDALVAWLSTPDPDRR